MPPPLGTLAAWWSLEEASGTRNDAHGVNHLTDVNTVTSTTGKVGTAAQFTSANSEALTRADNADLSGGDIGFTIVGWVWLDSLAAAISLVSKVDGSAANEAEYEVAFSQPGDGNKFIFAATGTGDWDDRAQALWGTSPAANEWHFFVARHDPTGNIISIQIDDGTPVTTAHTTGIANTSATFRLGQWGTGFSFHNGRLDQVAVWREYLSDADCTWLWNSGNGRTYSELAVPQKITELSALTSPLLTDLLTLVDAPGGSALNKKVTITSLISTFALLTNAVVQTFTVGSGTYTPTAGMKKVLAIGVGGGGAGAGGINTDSAGGGGGGGGTVIRLMTAAQIGASKAYVVGAAGAATTLDTAGALLNAGLGGAGVAGATFSVVGVSTAGGTGGTAANGDLNIPGQPGERGVIYSGADGRGGKGGSSCFGAGGIPGGTNAIGGNGDVYGGGGAGGHAAAASDRAGGTGAAGIMYLVEFLS